MRMWGLSGGDRRWYVVDERPGVLRAACGVVLPTGTPLAEEFAGPWCEDCADRQFARAARPWSRNSEERHLAGADRPPVEVSSWPCRSTPTPPLHPTDPEQA